jgi:hypothetical protein
VDVFGEVVDVVFVDFVGFVDGEGGGSGYVVGGCVVYVFNYILLYKIYAILLYTFLVAVTSHSQYCAISSNFHNL